MELCDNNIASNRQTGDNKMVVLFIF